MTHSKIRSRQIPAGSCVVLMDFEVVPVFQDTSHFTIEIFKWTREHETGYEGTIVMAII
jgi:hypothetical protein